MSQNLVRKMLVAALVIASAAPPANLQAKSTKKTPPVVMVSGPTIVAFFAATQAEIDNDPDANEALSDFQLYAGKLQKKLKKNHVMFHEIYEHAFELRKGKRSSLFRPKQDVGYYFVVPGRTPRVEYGVMTDADVLQVAKEYFGASIK